MNQKKDRSVISLILSALSLMVGVVWAGATVIIMGSMGTDVPAWRLGMLIAFSALFLFLGIRGLREGSGPLIVEGNEFPGVFEPKGRFLRSDQYGSLTEYRKYMKV